MQVRFWTYACRDLSVVTSLFFQQSGIFPVCKSLWHLPDSILISQQLRLVIINIAEKHKKFVILDFLCFDLI